MSLAKKILIFFFSLILGFVLLMWIVNRVGWQEIRQAFLRFQGWQALVIIGLTLLIPLAGIWKWKKILEGAEVKISFRELVSPHLSGFPFMFFSPMILMSGEVFRGYALRKKCGVGWNKAMASIVVDRVLDWTVALTTVLLGVLFFLFKIGLPPKSITLTFGTALLVITGAVSFFYVKSFRKESILKLFGINQGRAVEVEYEILNVFKAGSKKLFKIFASSFLIGLIKLIRVWLLITFLGKAIGLMVAVSGLGFFYLAIMLPIPAALGSHEVIQTFAFQNLGLKPGTATAFTMLLRGADLILALIGAIALFGLGFKFFKMSFSEKIGNQSKPKGR